MIHICEYCNQECRYVSQEVDERIYALPVWFSCDTCNVSYEKSLQGNLIMTRFSTILNGKRYYLDLLHFAPEAKILQIPDNMKKPIVIVLEIKNIDTKITPLNCKSKIETYITFS